VIAEGDIPVEASALSGPLDADKLRRRIVSQTLLIDQTSLLELFGRLLELTKQRELKGLAEVRSQK
jgi:hypothetical protein